MNEWMDLYFKEVKFHIVIKISHAFSYANAEYDI